MVDDAAGLAWIVNLGCIELHPHPVRAGQLDHPDELRVDLDPGPGVGWADVRHVAHGSAGAARRDGPARLAQDQRLARHARQCAHRAALDFQRSAPRGARAFPRRSNGGLPRLPAQSGGRKSGTASSSTTTRTPRIARRARPTRCGRCRTRAFRRRSTGTRCPTATRPTFTVFTMPERFAAIGDPHAGMDGEPARSEALLELAAQGRGRGPGRRAVAAALPQDGRRSAAGGAFAGEESAPSAAREDAADHGGELARQGSRARWPGAVEEQHPEAAALLAVDDVLVDSMRGRSSTWTRIRVNLRHVPEEQRPAQETPDPDDDPTREWREGKTHAASAKKSRELLRRHHFELRVGAVAGLLVGAPAAELRHVAEARCPACARTPPPRPARDAAAPTTSPCPGSSGSGRRACAADRPGRARPILPRDGSRARRGGTARDIRPARAASSIGEARADADVLQRARCRRRGPAASEPTSVSSPVLCQRKPATTQSQSRSCFTLNMTRLSGS